MAPTRNRQMSPSQMSPIRHWKRDFSPSSQTSRSRSNACSTPRPGETEEGGVQWVQDEAIIPEEAWIRELKGAFVHFGPGATIASISLPWDSSAARISKLPKDYERSAIAEYLHQQLFTQVPEENISPLPHSSEQQAADITMEDSGFAQRLVNAMEDDATCEFRGEHVIPYNHRAARFDTITRNKVSCSWHNPSRSPILFFSSEVAAQKVHKKFLEGNYRVDDKRVIPLRPLRGEGPYASSWTLKIHRVPEPTPERDISSDIDESDLPYKIRLGKPSYTLPDTAMQQIVRSLLNIGPLDSAATPPTDRQSWRSKLAVRFVDAQHAAEAVKKLHDKAPPFDEDGRLTVHQISTVRTRVPDYVYAAASQDINALHKPFKKSFVHATVSPGYTKFRKVKFEGHSRSQVAEALAAFQSVVAGELLTEDGGALWSASFATNAWAYNQMRDMQRRLGVLVLCDRQRRTLRLLGPREMFGAARAEIAKLCNQDPRCEFSIGLDPADADALPWLLRGGYQYLRGIVGRDKLALDVAGQPRRLVVSGSEVDLQVAQMLWNSRHKVSEEVLAAAGRGGAVAPGECALCGFVAEYPVDTRCRHRFCVGCFEAMCFSCAGTPARTPAVRCYGDGGRCKELLTLAAIYENLSSSALERLFERMFTTYLSANADQYRHCPTSGCQQIYRVRPSIEGVRPEAEFEFNCPQCMVAICSRCHVSHDTLHCPLFEQQDPDESSSASESGG